MTSRWGIPGIVIGLSAIGLMGPALGAEEGLTVQALGDRIASRPTGAEAEQLAKQVRGWFGKGNLAKGANPKVDGLKVAWAIELPGEPASPSVVSRDGSFQLPLARIGKTDVYAATSTLPDGTAMRWAYEAGGKEIKRDLGPRGRGDELEVYAVHPDSVRKPGVPQGKLTKQDPWKSEIYKGSTRDWWIYVPAQYKEDSPACLMVFQDGEGYTRSVPAIFDNLIASGEMPVTVGVFINPGKGPGEKGQSQRSLEYDTLSDRYARFLHEEILPEVEKTVKLRKDPESRGIAGSSSGGICAWTVAWERPDSFRRVLSWVGSFTNIASGASGRAGGHNYEAMIRKTDPKPIRVFLQDGSNDLDNTHGNWPLANQQMAKALQFKDYDYKFVLGKGFHSGKHGTAILPDSLRWLWRPTASR